MRQNMNTLNSEQSTSTLSKRSALQFCEWSLVLCRFFAVNFECAFVGTKQKTHHLLPSLAFHHHRIVVIIAI